MFLTKFNYNLTAEKIIKRNLANQGAGKCPGRKKKPNLPKSERFCQWLYVFDDSEQKVELKARIKPCSHQPNCMKFNERFLSYG